MSSIKELLSSYDSKYSVLETMNKLQDLLMDDKVIDAKELLRKQIILLSKDASNETLRRILQMMDTYLTSDKEVDDIIRYHISYTNIIKTTMYGTRWIYETDYNLISEVESVIVSTVDEIIPNKYDTLLTYTSAYNYNVMSALHSNIDDKIIQCISNIMVSIESLDVYLVHCILIEYHDMSIDDILELCDKLEKGSE